MSRLHLLILWLLASGAGFLFIKSKKTPDPSASKTKLETGSSVFPANLVDRIDEFKIEKDGQTVRVKKMDEQWRVAEQENFPANINTISRVFDALREAKVSQGVVASNEYYDRFQLDPAVENPDERPDSITLLTSGKEDAKLYLGKSRKATGGASETAGRFVRIAGDDSGVYIVQQSFATLDSDSNNWIDKDFSPLREGSIKISVSAPNDVNFKPWTISRKSVIDDFLMEGLSEKQETKINETGTLKNLFARSSFLELLSEEDAQMRRNEKGTREITAVDSSGASFLIRITPEKTREAEEDKAPDQAAAIPAENFITTLQVLNGPTKPEPPAENADTQTKAVYEQRLANLADLSANVNRLREQFEGRFFLLNKAPLAPVLKSRGEFIQKKKTAPLKASVTTPAVQVPGTQSQPIVPLQGGSPPPAIARPKELETKIEADTGPESESESNTEPEIEIGTQAEPKPETQPEVKESPPAE